MALAAVASLAVDQIQHVAAHSVQRNPLRHISRVEDPVLHTHKIHAHSSFELSFSIRDHARRKRRIRLSLEPNHDIIPEGATISYIEEDGSITYERVNRLDHRVFKGEAFIENSDHAEWMNAGWARIMVHHDGDHPFFEGAFHVDGDNHHIQSSRNYMQTRVRGDPDISDAEVEEDYEVVISPQEVMIVWKDSDIKGSEDLHVHYHDNLGLGDPEELKRRATPIKATCHSDRLDFNNEEDHPVYQGIITPEEVALKSRWQSMSPKALFGRQNLDGTTSGNGAGVNLAGSIGNTAGCPSTKKVALVGIATDCTYSAQFPARQNITNNVIQQMNQVSQLYESSFNITLGIQNLTIQPNNCPARGNPDSATPWNLDCNSGLTITDRLNLFSRWRGQTRDTNAFWTLLTTCPTDSAVGLAWLGQVCVQGSQQNPNSNSNETISSANVVVRTSTEWQVIAHEIGHTFGAVHDCVQSSCADGTVTRQQCCPLSTSSCDARGEFIMNPSTGTRITRFSPCSVGNICTAIGRISVRTQCLRDNRDVPQLISGSQCGNGIVEAGEQCDCGGASGCGSNPCCDPATCRFRNNAVCDFANEDCCTRQCTFAGNGTVCRASTGSCDPAETCPGNAASCPRDLTADDGTACGADGAGLTCASGQCTSRDLQCKTLMGARTNNDTYSCGSQGCQLSCSSPQFGSNTCLTMMQYFRDGTPCDGGGKCSNGRCQGATFANEVGTWIRENQAIFIPVVVVVGVLFLLAVVTCCVTRCRRKRRVAARRGRGNRVPKPPVAAVPPAWGNHPGGQRDRQRMEQTGWVPPLPPPRGARGPQRGIPNEPPPMYGQYGAPPRSMSMRYA